MECNSVPSSQTKKAVIQRVNDRLKVSEERLFFRSLRLPT